MSNNLPLVIIRKYISKEELEKLYPKKTRIEVHADGVKEVPDECPFCEIPCNEPHCLYTKEK